MQVTFNPGLTNTKSLNNNCCSGGKKVAFGKQIAEVTAAKLLSEEISGRTVWVELRGGLRAKTRELRQEIQIALNSGHNNDDTSFLRASLNLLPR